MVLKIHISVEGRIKREERYPIFRMSCNSRLNAAALDRGNWKFRPLKTCRSSWNRRTSIFLRFFYEWRKKKQRQRKTATNPTNLRRRISSFCNIRQKKWKGENGDSYSDKMHLKKSFLRNLFSFQYKIKAIFFSNPSYLNKKQELVLGDQW